MPLLLYIFGVLFTLGLEIKTKKRKLLIGLRIFLGICIAAGGLITWHQDKLAKLAKIADEEASKRKDEASDKRISDLITAFSVNSNFAPSVRIAVIDQQKTETELARAKHLEAKPVPVKIPTLDSIKKQGEWDHELARLDNEQKALQKARETVEAAERNRKSKEESDRAAEHQSNVERAWHAQSIEIFDYAITRLNVMLVSLAKESGAELATDFKNNSVTIHASTMVEGGRIVPEKNMIRLGTNDAWRFEIKTITASVEPQSAEIGAKDFPFALQITAGEQHSNAVVLIKPYKAGPMRHRTDRPTDGVTVRASLTYGAEFTERVTISDYAAGIDKSLDRIIAAQVYQFPLTPTGTLAK